MNHKEQLLQKIASKQACVGVIGLGYVGLPLALLFEESGFPVIGFDIDGGIDPASKEVACALCGAAVEKVVPVSSPEVAEAGIDDDPESPSFEILELLKGLGADAAYSDPYIPKARKVREHDLGLESVPCTADEFGRCDAIVVATAHSKFRDTALYAKAKLVIDTRNVVASPNGNRRIVRGVVQAPPGQRRSASSASAALAATVVTA